MNLINDLLLKTGVLVKITQQGQEKIQWFTGINFSTIFVSFIIPLFIAVIIAFSMKNRYNKKIQKEQITLSNFYDNNIETEYAKPF